MKTFKRLRVEAFLSQQELAARLGVSRQAISDWEHARARPGPENLKKLVAILGKDVSEILDALDASAEQAKKTGRRLESD